MSGESDVLKSDEKISPGKDERQVLKQDIFLKIERRLFNNPYAALSEVIPIKPTRPHFGLTKSIAAAAAVIGIVVIARFILPARSPRLQIVKTEIGEVFTVRLSDGTKIWLNAKSELRYPKNFASGKREIFLKGEAYLEVSKDAHHPFLVRTEKLSTQVLGTRFNIKAYEQAETEVCLMEGKVLVSNMAPASRRDSLYLAPNEKVALDPVSQKLYKIETTPKNGIRTVASTNVKAYKGRYANNGVRSLQTGSSVVSNIEDEAAWRYGTLAFLDAPMKEIALSLQRRFKINLGVASCLEGYKLSINLKLTDPETAVVDVCRELRMKYKKSPCSYNIQYKKEGDNYYIQ